MQVRVGVGMLLEPLFLSHFVNVLNAKIQTHNHNLETEEPVQIDDSELSWSTCGSNDHLRSSRVDPLKLCQAGRGPWADGHLQVFLKTFNWVQVRALADR